MTTTTPNTTPDQSPAERELRLTRERTGDSTTELKDKAADTADQFKRKAGNVADDLKEKARDANDQAGQAVKEYGRQASEGGLKLVEQGKTRAADEVRSFASAMRKAATELDQQDDSAIAGYANAAAGQVERLEKTLREKDPRALLGEFSRLTRRRPEWVLGGLFIGGLALARFLKASDQRNRQGEDGKLRDGEVGDRYGASGDPYNPINADAKATPSYAPAAGTAAAPSSVGSVTRSTGTGMTGPGMTGTGMTDPGMTGTGPRGTNL